MFPLAVAHMATEDDIYGGYFIPKGSIILGNAWYAPNRLPMLHYSIISRAILHSKKVFEDPEEFRPERYLKNGQLNLDVRQPEVSAFGFGRR